PRTSPTATYPLSLHDALPICTAEQKQKYLPILASGQKLSGFALTEPGAGSDLTALKTHAVLKGDKYIVNGEKLFITNAFCGRIRSEEHTSELQSRENLVCRLL